MALGSDPLLRFPRPPRPPRPPGLRPELQRRWKELLDHHDALANLDHFTLLGVADDASVTDMRRAFAIQVQRFHPDYLQDELVILKPYAVRILVRLNEARQLLSNRAERETYLRRLGRTPASAPALPVSQAASSATGAAELREQALALARQKRYEQAAAAMLRARLLDDGRAEYAALHAWLLYERDGRPSAPSEQTRRLLESALERDHQCEQAHYYQAIVLKRAGEIEPAMKHFRRAVELNPGNLEAARELRLHAARARVPARRQPPRLLQVLRAWCQR